MKKLVKEVATKIVVILVCAISGGSAWAEPERIMVGDGQGVMSVEEIRNELLALPNDAQAFIRGSNAQVANLVRTALADRRAAEFAKEMGLASTPETQARIARETRNILSRVYIENKLQEVRKSLPDFEKLAREQYLVDRESFKLSEAIKVSHILLKIDPEDEKIDASEVKAKAASILEELQKGADFATLAKAYSADTGSSKQGGELPGWQSKGDLVPSFERAAYALKPGEVSGLIKSRFGYHIIKLIEYRPARYQEFDEVKDKIIGKLKNKWMTDARAQIVSKLYGPKEIVISEQVMSELRVSGRTESPSKNK